MTSAAVKSTENVRLGLGPNIAQFSLLVVINAFVGAMVGLERSILPAIAEQQFHLAARAAVLSFIVVFGLAKAATNYLAGRLSDSVGRRRVLVAGWVVALPVPFLLMWAPTWSWVLGANVLLGVSQGLTWSTTVIMKIDLVGPERRGFAMGLNEFAGYGAVALSALATGYVAAAYGLRPQPFYLGVAFAAIGLLLSATLVRETHAHARHEARALAAPLHASSLSQREVFLRTSFRDRDLSSVSQAGLVNNLNDGMAWGLFPLFYAAAGISLERIAWLAAIYPGVWGLGQLFTGALSDRIGRKWLIAGGMGTQAAAIALIVLSTNLTGFAAGSALLGAGTAMVYPTLLAAIGDVAHPEWRASAVGVYRLWRDLGYAVGALLAGVTADLFGVRAAIWLVGAVTLASGAVVAIRMRETRRRIARGFVGTEACISPDELQERLERSEPLAILDVRTPEEFRTGHVDGARNVPIDRLPEEIGNLRGAGLVVTVCGSGGRRSEKAAKALRDRGLASVRSLCGGTRGWQERQTHGNEGSA
jgi:MFS family permease